MKARKAEDLRKLSAEDLATQLRDAQETLSNKRFQNALKTLDDTASIATLRRDIARINTVIHERELEAKG
jgi:large subunit ribosomal protein L29